MYFTLLNLKLLKNNLIISLKSTMFNSVESKMMQTVDHLAITSLAFILDENHYSCVFQFIKLKGNADVRETP